MKKIFRIALIAFLGLFTVVAWSVREKEEGQAYRDATACSRNPYLDRC